MGNKINPLLVQLHQSNSKLAVDLFDKTGNIDFHLDFLSFSGVGPLVILM